MPRSATEALAEDWTSDKLSPTDALSNAVKFANKLKLAIVVLDPAEVETGMGRALSDGRWRKRTRACAGARAGAPAGAPAAAEWRVCNRTGALLISPSARPRGTDFQTEGWWTVTPGSCSTPVPAPIRSRFLYLYAVDINGGDVTKGTVSMCVDSAKFRVSGIADCWRRGLQAVNFVEIDTADSQEWTTFLSETAK